MHRKLIASCLALSLVAPVALADPWKDESGHGRGGERWEDARGDRDRDWYRDRDWEAGEWEPGDRIPPFDWPLDERAEIPAGHLPPPGECRVWLPDRPAGHQPPPERC